MATSPVEFAAAFERLRNHLSVNFEDDSSILQLLEFWPKLAPLRENPAYSSYVAEYLAFLEAALTDDNLRDLSIDELTQLEALCLDSGMKVDLLQSVQKQIARQFFFVGKLDEGLAACIRVSKENAVVERRPSPESSLTEFESFRAFANTIDDQWPNTKILLTDIASEWQSEREFVWFDRINCLFVRMTAIDDKPRGKLRALTGSVEERGRNCQNDEVTFDNQLRASDDPMVGVAYQAMVATRHYLRSTGHPRLGSVYYHAHFSVADKQTAYTGDSIGIATALLAYAQLLHTEALRHDHLLPGDVACTGGIDEAGKVTPINGDTLHAKIERAFFSHIKYLALPVANATQARRYLDTLQIEYPARQLVLLPVNSLSAAINDHNIVRPEKVCIGEFVAKKAVRYSRMTKVQVPMLLVLAYLLLCVIYPKAWVGFDWRLETIELDGNRFKAINSDGQIIWKSCDFRGALDSAMTFGPHVALGRRYLCPTDVDSNGRVELFASPKILERNVCSAELYLFDSDGKQCWPNPVRMFEPTSYPGDISWNDIGQTLDYVSRGISIVEVQNYGKCVFSTAEVSGPAREQFMTIDASGQKVSGPYLMTGSEVLRPPLQVDEDDDGWNHLIVFGVNRREDRACLIVLDPAKLSGVSPPYDEELFIVSGMQKGSQLYYVSFPETRLSQGTEYTNFVSLIVFDPQSSYPYKITLREGTNRLVGDSMVNVTDNDTRLPAAVVTLDSNFIPFSYLFGTGSFAHINSILISSGKQPYPDQDSLQAAQLNDIIVYHGDSIVHHPAAGIFYKRP